MNVFIPPSLYFLNIKFILLSMPLLLRDKLSYEQNVAFFSIILFESE